MKKGVRWGVVVVLVSMLCIIHCCKVIQRIDYHSFTFIRKVFWFFCYMTVYRRKRWRKPPKRPSRNVLTRPVTRSKPSTSSVWPKCAPTWPSLLVTSWIKRDRSALLCPKPWNKRDNFKFRPTTYSTTNSCSPFDIHIVIFLFRIHCILIIYYPSAAAAADVVTFFSFLLSVTFRHCVNRSIAVRRDLMIIKGT